MGNRSICAVLLAIAGAANLLGYTADLYQRIPWFDEGLHAFTLFALTFTLALYLQGRVLGGRERHPILLGLTIVGLGLALGTVWEFLEWGYDQIVSANAIKGKADTILDLWMDAAGAAAAALLAQVRLRGRRENPAA